MPRFIAGFIGTTLLMILFLAAAVAWTMVKNDIRFEDAMMLLTLGLSVIIPVMGVLAPLGGAFWMWVSPAGRFSGRIEFATQQQGNNFTSWIYGKTRIGGKNAGTAVLSSTLNGLWQETRNRGQEGEFFKMGRAIIAIRSPSGTRRDWNLGQLRAAYPIFSSLMLFAILLGGLGLFWLVPVYIWGSLRAGQVIRTLPGKVATGTP